MHSTDVAVLTAMAARRRQETKLRDEGRAEEAEDACPFRGADSSPSIISKPTRRREAIRRLLEEADLPRGRRAPLHAGYTAQEVPPPRALYPSNTGWSDCEAEERIRKRLGTTRPLFEQLARGPE